MITKFEGFVFIIVLVIVVTAGEIMLRDRRHEVKYDCRMVDVNPDMPEEVKKICRGRR